MAATAAAAVAAVLPGPVRGHVAETTTAATRSTAGAATGARAGADVLALARASAGAGAAVASGAVGVMPAGSSRPRAGGAISPRGRWSWPLRPQPAVVRGFEPPPQPWAGGHRGVDLAGRAGQAVLAAGDGVVGFSGVVAGRGVVTVRHAGGWRTTYEPLDHRAATGTPVRQGDRIGTLTSGAASHCSPGACLHWGAVTGAADYHDPLLLLGLGHPVLLPLVN